MDPCSREFFEQLESALRKHVDGDVMHVNLSTAWKACSLLAESGRLRAALLDLQLNVVSLDAELFAIGKMINPSAVASSGWSCPEEFPNRIQLFTAATSYVMRYRAIWDKLMGIVVLLVAHESYEEFLTAKSRKTRFHKIIFSKGGSWEKYADEVREIVTAFDDRFRTTEAHGTGLVRKLVFLSRDAQLDAFQNLFWAYNSLNRELLRLQKVIDGVNASNQEG